VRAKMIKVFIPEIKCRQKTSIRGFWRNEAGQIFYDYLSIKEFAEYPSYRVIEALRVKYNQEALAIIGDSLTLNIFYSNRQEVLLNRIYAEVKRQNLKAEIREALRQYSGVTIYQEAGRFYKEIFYK
jgi:hypothetical protein